MLSLTQIGLEPNIIWKLQRFRHILKQQSNARFTFQLQTLLVSLLLCFTTFYMMNTVAWWTKEINYIQSVHGKYFIMNSVDMPLNK